MYTRQISTSSRATAEAINFGQSIQQLIVNKVVTDKSDIDDDVIKLLAEFLDVRDYKTNLVSSWLLRTIAEQIISASNEISTHDYSTFVLWLHEEINLVFDSPDVQREQFFELMSNLFYQTLSEILNGKGVLLPSQLLYHETKIDTEFAESISSTSGSDDKNALVIIAKSDREQVEDESFERKSLELINLDEQLLNVIIESTYQIFGTKLNYTLIRAACENQKDIVYYTIPYHFRNPRIVQKFEISRQASTASNPKNEKMKKRKSSKKSFIEEMTEITKLISVFDINQFRFILPLSEALEADNVMYTRKNSEIETNSNSSNVIKT
ncbi:uncharacterized protein LOC100677928 isoform X2 [Nasonia vitripennis]|uniref:Uncharacterized protein n=1 Tax=Nasonia vitripennis TaxID=7425 RepID=A0A7M7HA51_NASVI|nr:uncharacterized protein LOC100677928 isoform X2 [Nasonia vitripennis]